MEKNYQKFHEVISVVESHFEFMKGPHYQFGVIREPTQKDYTFEKEYLLTQPIGTYMIIGAEDLKLFLIKWTEKEIKEIREINPIFDIDSYVLGLVDGCLSFEEGYDASFNPIICNSILDISFLSHLDPFTFHREINSWTEGFLKNIRHLYFMNDSDRNLKTVQKLYVQLIKMLAGRGLRHIQVHVNKSRTMVEDKTEHFCLDTWGHFKNCGWAMDRFLEVNIYNTHSPKTNSINQIEIEWNVENLKEKIASKTWQYLPDKKPFFKALGSMWSTIVESLPEKDRREFRINFMVDRGAYLYQLKKFPGK